ncbi:MAG TPA: hypothetical protein HA264_00770 [Methanolinea sp.]|jgi:hypothetical protein|nr:MAG: hypothetical protein A4E36_00656 [Methanoregulaceae archaeon PtaB.Bin009]OPY40368.1 MAG: hypothetical protein A4E41_01423 [Methanoregulaceae archaeon PtaU1.Bin066]HII75594.1 hypothetical protein [Methanolinea sp.]HNQ28697.1 hypothetical protein [Methanolinea sp.]
MKGFRILMLLLLGCCAILAFPATAAETTVKSVLYQSDFSESPGWNTNSPTRYYWDPSLEMYHFKTEGGTNGYAFIPVKYNGQSFIIDFDVVILTSQKESGFRFGLISSEMDFTRGTNVLSSFENGKYGKIMSLRVIDQNNQLREATSYYTSYCGNLPGCQTVEFKENMTYHVTARYTKELQHADIKVTEKESGELVWGYFVSVGRDLFFMDRLAITTRGDYAFGPFLEGYIDNVELVVFNPVETTPTTAVPMQVPTDVTTIPTTTVPTTPTPTPTPSTPLGDSLPLAAMGIAGSLLGNSIRRKRLK